MSKTLILDGGMSRELLRLGAPLKQPEWSALALMETPELVEQVHREFIEAGADVITTNSYALVPFHIGEERFQRQGATLLADAGRLARQAAGQFPARKITVAGSLPPIFGSYEPERFDAAHVQDYLRIFVDNLAPFVDVWLGETLSLIAEGQAVAEAVKATDKPFWISFTLNDDADALNGAEARLRGGESVEAAAHWAANAGASALLFNCSRPEVMQKAVATAKAVFDAKGVKLPIGVYANGLDDNEGQANEGLSDVRDDLNASSYSHFACDWVAAGASMVGGCCGIGACHIQELAHIVNRPA
ncbi:homocysteine S-methyltransferase family protein [Bartonella sp. LJL80]